MRPRMLAGSVIAAVLLITGTISAAQAHVPAGLQPRQPEALVYAPDADGTLVPAAVECPSPSVQPAAGSNLQDMLDLYALKRQLAALQRRR